MNMVEKDFEGLAVKFTGDGWFNATPIAAKYGKRPNDWLNRDDVKRYVNRLCELNNTNKSKYTKTKRGNPLITSLTGNCTGTWLHRDLGIKFAQWLDVDFEIWCNEQIKDILIGTLDQKRARHQATASFKLVTDVLKITKEDTGEAPKPYHYINEARMMNWALTGTYSKVDRDALSIEELDCLAWLEEHNAALIGADLSYKLRKEALKERIDNLKSCKLEFLK